MKVNGVRLLFTALLLGHVTLIAFVASETGFNAGLLAQAPLLLLTLGLYWNVAHDIARRP